MIKKRYFSTKHDFKTGFYYRLSLTLGLFLLILFVFLKIFSFILNENSTGFLRNLYEVSKGTAVDSIGAFSLIFIAVGIIIYFLYRQFVKLNEIADEIEKDMENIEE